MYRAIKNYDKWSYLRSIKSQKSCTNQQRTENGRIANQNGLKYPKNEIYGDKIELIAWK